MRYLSLLLLLLMSGCATMPKINPASTVTHTSAQIRSMIVDEFKEAGLRSPSIGRFKDKLYTLPDHDDMVDALEYIASFITPKLTYNKEAADCDNFAGLIGNILPFATDYDTYEGHAIPLAKIDLYWDTPHEVIAWIDNKGFWIAEPQAKKKAKIFNVKELPQAKTIYALDPI